MRQIDSGERAIGDVGEKAISSYVAIGAATARKFDDRFPFRAETPE